MTSCCSSTRPQLQRSAGLWQQCACAVLGGLLCSSCCVVQLALNSLSIGCASFAVLSPYRPYLLSITAAALAGSHIRYRNTRRTGVAVAIALGLSVAPEVVQLYNKNKLRNWAARLTADEGKRCNTAKAVRVRVDGMKCLACCARVKSHILATTGACSCEVDLDTGTVQIEGATQSLEAVLKSIQDLGYRAKILEPTGKRLPSAQLQ